MPDRVESFEKINSSENRPRARPGLVKPIRNGRSKKQNLMKSRLSSAETGLAGRERMKLGSRKKSICDRMMRSRSFQMQEVGEIGRKKAGESRGLSMVWIGIV